MEVGTSLVRCCFTFSYLYLRFIDRCYLHMIYKDRTMQMPFINVAECLCCKHVYYINLKTREGLKSMDYCVYSQTVWDWAVMVINPLGVGRSRIKKTVPQRAVDGRNEVFLV